MTEEKEKEVIKIDEQCSIIFDKKGNVTLGNCKGKKINPAELYFLNRVNDAKGNH